VVGLSSLMRDARFRLHCSLLDYFSCKFESDGMGMPRSQIVYEHSRTTPYRRLRILLYLCIRRQNTFC
jgi:hypothetical protein